MPERDFALMERVDIYLGLGTNLGDRKKNIIEALQRLDDAFGCGYAALSGFYETEPWGFDSDEKFLNAAVKYSLTVPQGTSRPDFAHGILRICKDVEKAMGRTGQPEYDNSGNRIYKSRIIDIDILMAGDWRIDENDLKIPHPLMKEREFVMMPLSEILP